jgi:hypothetical protein
MQSILISGATFRHTRLADINTLFFTECSVSVSNRSPERPEGEVVRSPLFPGADSISLCSVAMPLA